MKSSEISSHILDGARSLVGKELEYLSGSNSFTPESVDEGRIRGSRAEGPITLSTHMIETYAKALERGQPIHIDTAMGGAGNERSALEALVAHLPFAGAIPRGKFNGKNGKHIVWFDQPVNTLGQIRDVTADWQSLRGGPDTKSSIQACSLSKSLLAKPFLILTGPSGTGKTRGAVDLAGKICQPEAEALVAVGADWTDNRHVLGYLNPLETLGEGKLPIYETTPILDLILHANENPEEPHLLILDEMNLSHVERYFADFLSAMELKDKENALKLHAAGSAVTRKGVEVRGNLDFPGNLFVIGTVNIDETTYMFSPKVLDRANVIEIHAEEAALGDFLKGHRSADGVDESKDYGISFLEAARAIQSGDDEKMPVLPESVRDSAAEHLMAIFRIMKRGRGEFGFRTCKEVMAYLRAAHFLAGPEEATRAEARQLWAHVKSNDQDAIPEAWLEALDAQILQKILPKLHGSRSKLGPMLGALAHYCATGNESEAMQHYPGENGDAPKHSLKDASRLETRKFKSSYEKLQRMIEVLLEEQFVSFIC